MLKQFFLPLASHSSTLRGIGSFLFLSSVSLFFSLSANAQEVTSPDGKVKVAVTDANGSATYTVTYEGDTVMTPSRLGLRTNYADFTQGVHCVGSDVKQGIVKDYEMTRTKQTKFHYVSNQADFRFEDKEGNQLIVTFQVADGSVAFRYTLPRPKKGLPLNDKILCESTSFNFPQQTTTFLCPQTKPGWGYARTSPSYETEYTPDAELTRRSQHGLGFTLPGLFKVGRSNVERSKGERKKGTEESPVWALVSETGVTSDYCASRLADYEPGVGFPLSFPQQGENNGFTDAEPTIMLPGSTPWRTIALGRGLKAVVESTVQFDVVDPLYDTKYDYKPGRYTWSWLIWQDNATNYDDQVKFIDVAAEMGYEYCLVDAFWDTKIGYDRMAELSQYAQSKGVSLLLWYNSNGWANDAGQGPLGIMNNTILRKREMAWMQKVGIKGIKVDFFGGDKQATIKLYEDILSDANDYGLGVIFHGCTLPRGWERMYPNFIASEAALASENVYFSEYHAKKEGFEMTMYPYTRNAVGSFDWGGVILNKYLSRDNKSRHPRYTTNMFEIATAFTNQCSINCVELTPNGKDDVPAFQMELLRQLPTTWTETRFVDGYPGKYFVVERKATNGKTYVAGINGTNEPLRLTLSLPQFAGQTLRLYIDDLSVKTLSVNKKGEAKITIPAMGGMVICQNETTAQTFFNPVIDADYPDVDIIRVEDDYYLLSTTMFHFPGATILHSKDMVNWEFWAQPLKHLSDRDGYNLLNGQHEYRHGMWASGLKYHDGKYYLLLNAQGLGSFIMWAEDLRGEWSMKRLDHTYYDSNFLFDNDGKIYIAYGYNHISVAEVDQDWNYVRSEEVVVRERSGLEGNHLYHIGDYYYLYCTYGGYPSGQAAFRSKSPWGPYEEKVLLEKNINGRINTVHQGAMVQTQTGEWWSMLFEDEGAGGRMPHLQPITWRGGWPIHGKNGVPLVECRYPNVGTKTHAPLSNVTATQMSDDFDGSELKMQWQWNHQPVAGSYSLTERPGWLRLKTVDKSENLKFARGSLTERISGFRNKTLKTATIKMDISHMVSGDVAGLSVFQDPYAYIAVEKHDGRYEVVWHLDTISAQTPMPAHREARTTLASKVGDLVYLRAEVDLTKGEARYSYSTDGETFLPLGEVQPISFNLSVFVGARWYLFNFARQQSGGYVDIDYLKSSEN